MDLGVRRGPRAVGSLAVKQPQRIRSHGGCQYEFILQQDRPGQMDFAISLKQTRYRLQGTCRFMAVDRNAVEWALAESSAEAAIREALESTMMRQWVDDWCWWVRDHPDER